MHPAVGWTVSLVQQTMSHGEAERIHAAQRKQGEDFTLSFDLGRVRASMDHQSPT